MKGSSDAGVHCAESGQIDEVLIIKVSSAEMKLADELHVPLDTSGNEVRAIFERPAEELHHVCSQLCQELMTHVDEDPEIDSWCFMTAAFTSGHFTPGSVSIWSTRVAFSRRGQSTSSSAKGLEVTAPLTSPSSKTAHCRFCNCARPATTNTSGFRYPQHVCSQET